MFRAALVYLVAALGCLACGLAIHRVVHVWYDVSYHSDYLTFGFLYPLIGGTIVCLLIGTIKTARMPGSFVANVYSSGIAALTAGSMLRGTFYLAGRSSPYLSVFVVAGIAMVSVGAVGYIAAQFRKTTGH